MDDVPGLGKVTQHESFDDWFVSKKILVPALQKKCQFILHEDEKPNEIHEAIANMLAAKPSILTDASEHVFAYYTDFVEHVGEDDMPKIKSADSVWKYVSLGKSLHVQRASRDGKVYVSYECNCDWEIEHGLQIVFKNGQRINKVGPFDGRLTNSDPKIIYRKI